MDLAVIAVAFVALVGLWCLVVLPAVWLSGTMSQEEEGHEGGIRAHTGDEENNDAQG